MTSVTYSSRTMHRDEPADGVEERLAARREELKPNRGTLVVPSWLVMLALNWKALLICTLLAALAAGVPLALAPRQYAAESLIAPTESWTQVQFEPKIKTVDSNAPQPNQPAVMTPERRQALVDLIRS